MSLIKLAKFKETMKKHPIAGTASLGLLAGGIGLHLKNIIKDKTKANPSKLGMAMTLASILPSLYIRHKDSKR